PPLLYPLSLHDALPICSFSYLRVAKAIGSHGARPTTRPNRTITRHGAKQVYSGRRFLAPGGGQSQRPTRRNWSHVSRWKRSSIRFGLATIRPRDFSNGREQLSGVPKCSDASEQ